MIFRSKPRFEPDDPLSNLHVRRTERLDHDEGDGSNAITDATGDDAQDLDRYRPGGDLYINEIVDL